MTNYIELATHEYPLTLDAVRQKCPNMSIPAGALEIPGFAAVSQAAPTAPAPGNKLVEIAPAEITPGNWQQRHLEVPFTQAEIDVATQSTITALTEAVQRHLDSTARQRNYEGILSACTYASSTNPQFVSDGLACVAWRDAVWASCYQIMGEVQAGARAIPTEPELISILPAMSWPI